MRGLRRLRYRVGRWLLRPEARRIRQHYMEAETKNYLAGREVEGERCAYIAIGVNYLGTGWHG